MWQFEHMLEYLPFRKTLMKSFTHWLFPSISCGIYMLSHVLIHNTFLILCPPPPPPTTWRLLYMCDWVHIHNSFCFCNIPCFFRLKFYSHNMSLNLCFISSTIRLLVLIFAMVMTMKDIFLYTAVYICISSTLFPI